MGSLQAGSPQGTGRDCFFKKNGPAAARAVGAAGEKTGVPRLTAAAHRAPAEDDAARLEKIQDGERGLTAVAAFGGHGLDEFTEGELGAAEGLVHGALGIVFRARRRRL